MSTFIKKSGVGASSVQSDDPSKDEDRNSRNNQSSKSKCSQEQRQNSNQAKSEKDSRKAKIPKLEQENNATKS